MWKQRLRSFFFGSVLKLLRLNLDLLSHRSFTKWYMITLDTSGECALVFTSKYVSLYN